MIKNLTTLFVALLISEFYCCQTISNEVISSAGETQSNATVSIDFSVGEPAIETISNSSNTLTQGFHQTQFLYINLTEIHDPINVISYPNPVVNELTVEIPNNSQTMDLVIYSMEGKIIESFTIKETLKISFSKFTPGTYIIYLKNNTELIKSYKIIKS